MCCSNPLLFVVRACVHAHSGQAPLTHSLTHSLTPTHSCVRETAGAAHKVVVRRTSVSKCDAASGAFVESLFAGSGWLAVEFVVGVSF